MTATMQRIGLATSVNSLRAELDAGGELNVCFLFDEPRRNWIGTNNTIQALRQVATGDTAVTIEGTVQQGNELRFVSLTLDITTGNGHATFGASLTNEDLRVLEVSYAAINRIAATAPSLI